MARIKQAEPLTPAKKKRIKENVVVEVVYLRDHEYYQAIEAVLKRKLSNEQKTEIEKGGRIWAAQKKYYPKTAKGLPRIPSSDELRETRRQKIEDLRAKTQDLIRILEENAHLIDAYGVVDKTIDGLYMILRFAESAQKEAGRPAGKKPLGEKGRPADLCRRDFIRRMGDIYTDITGQDKRQVNKSSNGIYEGPFFRFIEACIKPYESMSNKALGRAINTALEHPAE